MNSDASSSDLEIDDEQIQKSFKDEGVSYSINS